jgi:hypothetical protein
MNRPETIEEIAALVEVAHREQVSSLGLDPERLVQALALGTVPVATRVVEGALAPAMIAAL